MLLRRLLGKWADNYWVYQGAQLIFVIIPIAFIIRTFGFGLYQVPTGSMEPTLLVGERFFADKLTYWFREPKRGEIIAFNSPDSSACPTQGFPYSKNWFKNLVQRYIWIPFIMEGPSNWTKRVIAVGGDHIVGKIEDDKPVIYLNDSKLPLQEPYVNTYPLIELYAPVSSWVPNLKKSDARYRVVYRTFDPNRSFEKEQPFYQIDPSRIVLRKGKPVLRLPGTARSIDVFDVQLAPHQFWVMGDNRLNSGDSREWGILPGNLIHGRIIFRIWSSDSEEAWWPIDLLKHPISFWSKIRWSRCLQFVH